MQRPLYFADFQRGILVTRFESLRPSFPFFSSKPLLQLPLRRQRIYIITT